MCNTVENNVKIESPLVFISYSWENDEHVKWVSKLSMLLMSNGIDALLDRYEVFVGSNLDKFMIDGLNNSRYIICVCSESYIHKMNNKHTGVGKEMDIISTFQSDDHIIPIIRGNVSSVPIALQGKFYVDFNTGDYVENLSKLIYHIHGKDYETKPNIGNSPFRNTYIENVVAKTQILKTTYHNPDLCGDVKFNYLNNDGLFTIGTGNYEFTTKWSSADEIHIYAYNDSKNISAIGLLKDNANINETPSIESIDFTSRYRMPKIGDSIIWINKHNHLAITSIIGLLNSTRGDETDEITYQYRIFL